MHENNYENKLKLQRRTRSVIGQFSEWQSPVSHGLRAFAGSIAEKRAKDAH